MKKCYSKPVVTRIELRPMEAVLAACKTSVWESTTAHDLGGVGGCAPLFHEACRDMVGS